MQPQDKGVINPIAFLVQFAILSSRKNKCDTAETYHQFLQLLYWLAYESLSYHCCINVTAMSQRYHSIVNASDSAVIALHRRGSVSDIAVYHCFIIDLS